LYQTTRKTLPTRRIFVKTSIFIKPALLALAILALTSSAAAQTPDIGWYTANPEADTFWISTADELAGLAELVNGSEENNFKDTINFAGKTIVLTDDIDLSGYGVDSEFNDGKGWVPIGAYETSNHPLEPILFPDRPFYGVFDGSGKMISGLINNTDLFWGAGLFGHLGSGGEVKNVGLVDVKLISYDGIKYSSTGSVVGWVNGGNVTNCYSTGIIAIDRGIVGGVVGVVGGGSVTNCYFIGTISVNDGHAGGVAGFVFNGSSMINSYSTATINALGTISAGGVAGNFAGEMTNCAALNSSIQGYLSSGRVIGRGTTLSNSNNVAFTDMSGSFPDTTGPSTINGADITISQIHSDGTIGGLFTDSAVWTIEPGKLPGLFGSAVDMPEHLQTESSVLSGNRAIPVFNSDEEAFVFPHLVPLVGQLTAGPNPVGRQQSGAIYFFRQGKLMENTVLIIYDASGNLVNRISLVDKTADITDIYGKRQIGSWAFTDMKGKAVSEGVYLARGVITVGGKRENISLVLGVRTHR
jgi:hypothetical protein